MCGLPIFQYLSLGNKSHAGIGSLSKSKTMLPRRELSIIFPSLFLKIIFPTEVKSVLSFCKIFAICCIVISDSEVWDRSSATLILELRVFLSLALGACGFPPSFFACQPRVRVAQRILLLGGIEARFCLYCRRFETFTKIAALTGSFLQWLSTQRSHDNADKRC